MLSWFLFVGVVISATLAEKEECQKLFNLENFRCCKQQLPIQESTEDIKAMKECLEKMKPNSNCDYEICVAKKLGHATKDDGTYDKNAMEEGINKSFEKVPELAETMVKNCVNGDLTEYGSSDLCDLLKLGNCFRKHVISSCSDWDPSEKCTEIQELVVKCK